jgi:predicted Rossmann-fold nucleotide-binding protein
VNDPYIGMVQAMHDASVLQGINRLMKEVAGAGLSPIAVMGGHAEPRNSDTYRKVARMAKSLAESGFFLASGGGPGCMEATHLGVLLAGKSESDLDDAIRRLSIQPYYPTGVNRFISQKPGAGGWVVEATALRSIVEWFLPAYQLANELLQGVQPINQSLAVPTWHYGHEMTTPLATHIAKFFLNSIREDILLSLAKSGVVFARGKAGTLQEIFQYSAGVYYGGHQKTGEEFPSMIFLDRSFWGAAPGQSETALPVRAILETLFTQHGSVSQAHFEQYWHFVDTGEEAVQALKSNKAHLSSARRHIQTYGLSHVES